MMTAEQIKSVLYKTIKENPVLGVIPEIVKDVHAPIEIEKGNHERIVIDIPGGIESGQIARALVGVKIFVPDTKRSYGDKEYPAPNSQRLSILEDVCINMFDSPVYGEFNNEKYLYSRREIITENDEATESHFL